MHPQTSTSTLKNIFSFGLGEWVEVWSWIEHFVVIPSSRIQQISPPVIHSTVRGLVSSPSSQCCPPPTPPHKQTPSELPPWGVLRFKAKSFCLNTSSHPAHAPVLLCVYSIIHHYIIIFSIVNVLWLFFFESFFVHLNPFPMNIYPQTFLSWLHLHCLNCPKMALWNDFLNPMGPLKWPKRSRKKCLIEFPVFQLFGLEWMNEPKCGGWFDVT